MRNIESIYSTLCTGCSACSNSCPQNAIAMKHNGYGFYIPEIDYNICIDCGICDNVCPIIDHKPSTYAIWASDEIRMQSSSGGFFSVIAEYVLNNGGVVFGAAWTTSIFVKHTFIESISDLDILRRSKYVQSEIGDSYKKVEYFLKEGRQVLFTGTPCQISGLYSMLGKNANTSLLITLDFVCYYNPSIFVLRKYLHDNYGIENIASVNFRTKKFGWISAVMEITLKNGEHIDINDMNDPFFLGYFNGYYAREACLKCKFASFPHKSDFTMGDFWKIEQHDSTWNDGLGTSMVFANNSKANKIINFLKAKFKRVEKVPFDWIREGQHNRHLPPQNKQYFNHLLRYKSFNDAIRMAYNSIYDVGLVCVMNYKNYGSAITNYALYKIIEDCGKSVYIIRQPANSDIKPTAPINFETFNYPQYSLAPIYNNIEDMKVLNNRCKQFVVGSDQLFNYNIYRQISGFIKLNWVDDLHSKSAFAASFGSNRILSDIEETLSLKNNLLRFKHFSVREESSISFVKNNFDIMPEFVLDPVFLCDIKHYRCLTANLRKHNVEIFSYILDPQENTAVIIKDISDRLKLSVTAVTDMWRDKANIESCWNLPTEINFSNEKWLASLMNCKFVIADSFHATCFAIIFNKPFVVIPNKQRGETRVLSLLNSLDIDTKRVLYNTDVVNDTEYLLNSINFDEVNKKLSILKERSFSFLRKILELDTLVR
ncbi:MAG: Coenzyme F420 hydrogenase/dehydrogenase, beta subunit C-terminal domain [Lachnospiraceae bacterium]|nr:Coenzyme F420 hydrogenase/dehydrogenase, beta subunit C-terminal domain [Lachnospiraceae bacterium]